MSVQMMGVIADDFTGATDVAVAFRRSGRSAVVLFGIPDGQVELGDAEVVVVALKSRSIPPEEAVEQSLAALAWLQSRGASRFFFKFCSTFDSRPEGNIGPVADALADALGADVVPVVPSSPEHGRTQYQGHLFVHDQLLSDSPMRDHPITPMRDARVPLLMQPQTRHGVTLIAHRTVRDGREAVANALQAAQHGTHYAVIDAITPEDLDAIGGAVIDLPLVTGAAGLAAGIARASSSRSGDGQQTDPVGAVRSAALAGSCSARTLEQVDRMRSERPSFRIDAMRSDDPRSLADEALAWVDGLPDGAQPLLYSSLPSVQLAEVQAALGVDGASRILETAMGLIARGLRDRGVRRIAVAGGETSGAVVSALGVRGGAIGAEAAPGVPWIYTLDDEPLALLLKSGNFGERDLLLDAVNTGEEVRA